MNTNTITVYDLKIRRKRMKKMNKFSLRILFFILCVFALPRLAVADTAVKPNIVDPHYKAVVVVKDTPFAGFNGGYAGRLSGFADRKTAHRISGIDVNIDSSGRTHKNVLLQANGKA